VQFGAKSFALGVTGGTRGYFAALGQVKSAPATGNAQRFDLQLAAKPK
jgi:hypothetical protein